MAVKPLLLHSTCTLDVAIKNLSFLSPRAKKENVKLLFSAERARPPIDLPVFNPIWVRGPERAIMNVYDALVLLIRASGHKKRSDDLKTSSKKMDCTGRWVRARGCCRCRLPRPIYLLSSLSLQRRAEETGLAPEVRRTESDQNKQSTHTNATV